VRISCLLTQNATEAAVKVKLRLGCTAGQEVSISIKAWSCDYGDKCVTLISRQSLDIYSGKWTLVTLEILVVGQPYHVDSKLVVDVDPRVTKPLDKSYLNIIPCSLKFRIVAGN
jgi:hypothetical protein